MKRASILFLVAVLLFCSGCKKNWSEEEGHIYRSDIEIGDFAFLFDELEYMPGETTAIELFNGFKYDTTTEEIFDAVGLPSITTDSFGVKEYIYLIGGECDTIAIMYGSDEGIMDFDPYLCIDYSEEIVYELWAAGERKNDEDRYNMNKRFDIDESELSFIDEETNSDKLQQVLGAPHYYIETYDVNIEGVHGNVFVYELENKNVGRL